MWASSRTPDSLPFLPLAEGKLCLSFIVSFQPRRQLVQGRAGSEGNSSADRTRKEGTSPRSNLRETSSVSGEQEHIPMWPTVPRHPLPTKHEGLGAGLSMVL